MSAVLTPGANCALPKGVITATVSYTPIPNTEIDISAFLLTANGKVRGDGDMCFYGQTSVQRSAIQMVSANPGVATYSLNLDLVEAAIEKVALTATIYENQANFGACANLQVTLSNGAVAAIPTTGKIETALILGEFYRRNNEWKFRCVAQGFAGGLEPLAKHFGVDIAVPHHAPPSPIVTPPPAPTPTAAPKPINLNKISLDKRQSSVSLEKKDGNFGEIKVNLNWNRGSQGGGLFGFGKAKGVDLDVGCLYELKNGEIGAVQALGNSFGSYRDEPFIELMGDDRTGASADGEWLRINGSRWAEVKRIIVFCFIYEGVPSWHATDAVVTIYAPGQPPIEVRLNEEGGQQGMCAIALLENINGTVRVNREVRFFAGHSKLDQAYGWGLSWRAGSK
ncbi:tellurium resistance protein TerA [Pseudomonas neustonica]|uniref:Tellurium resistance protein TerA n=1 Tax=Pseudomonas neustonica TaxID=2487346 RepID=A0ABX9XDC4_9PSED|nr:MULTISPECIES: TerD family protein [Pseudomonas]ROZ80230.1 tellurium resistance protein TerA [Pseudomonas sp. SSM44]ROZ80745.1 tellurium resistance protein TerA [Pseudomonas neustonica]|tara:strand:+ start:1762 stop:2946 length:1185 start_codon:yes stop_codon:yes gene_type:complete